MTTSKRVRRSMSIRDKSFATPITSISQTTENHSNNLNHKESSHVNQLVDLQQQTGEFHNRKSKLIQNHLEIITKNKHTNAIITKTVVDRTQNNSEDDWVCPVAVALRRAGYNVPLRPSKSWLERDRKQQALLREQQTSSKET